MTLAGLAVRNLFRNKVRTLLTVMGVSIAIITFLLLRTVSAAWTAGADYAAKDRVVTRHKVTFVMTLPKRYVDHVKETPGIKSVTWANWFGGKDPNNDREFFATLAVDGKTYFDVVPELEVPKDQYQAFMEDRTGAIIGDVLAQQRGWKIGQQVTLESGIFPAPPDDPWTFTIRGIYTTKAKNVDRVTMLFHWDYINERLPDARKDQVGWIMSRVEDPSRTADVGIAIDKVFDDKDTQTLSQDEHSFATSFLAGFSAVLRAFDVVSIVILVIMMLVLGNTIAMGVRERTSELATMRAIGFLPGHIRLFILGEAALLGAIGGAVGLVFGLVFVNVMFGRVIEENMGQFFPVFRVPVLVAVVAFFLSLGLGLLASLWPAEGAARLRVTEALRRVA
jgi:putative ABC transport system permease protein